MEVKVRKIGILAAGELEALSKAGQILGDIKRAFEAGDVTEMDDTAKGLFGALREVLDKVNK